MFHGDLVQETHISDAATPGFRKFLQEWGDKANTPGYFVQFTKSRSNDDKRLVGASGHLGQDPYQDQPENGIPDADDIETLKALGLDADHDPKALEKKKINRDREIEHVKKLGLRDQTIYRTPNHNDPVGLYAYPLDYVINHPYDIAYGADYEHMRVIKMKEDTKVLNIQKTTEQDIRNFVKNMGWGDIEPEAIKTLLSDRHDIKSRDGNVWGHIIWWMFQHNGQLKKFSSDGTPGVKDEVRWVPLEARGASENDFTDFADTTSAWETMSNNAQNARIRKGGWEAVNDNNPEGGKAVIYRSEPEQVVFLNRRSYDIVDSYTLAVKERRKTGSAMKGMIRNFHFPGVGASVNREFAEKIVKILGDKITETISKMGGSGPGNLPGIGAAISYMLGTPSVEVLADPMRGSENEPAIYKTKRGLIGLHFYTDKPKRNSGVHRSEGTDDHRAVQIDYVDARGVSKVSSTNRSITAMATYLLHAHPMIAAKDGVDITDHKEITRARDTLGELNQEIYKITADSDTFTAAESAVKSLNEILTIFGKPNFPINGTNDIAAVYLLMMGALDQLSGSNTDNLGAPNLTLGTDGVLDQKRDIAEMHGKVVDSLKKKQTKPNIHPNMARMIAGKDDYFYASDCPAIYLKLHPEHRPVLDAFLFVVTLVGKNIETLRTSPNRAAATIEQAIERTKKLRIERPAIFAQLDHQVIGTDKDEHERRMSLEERAITGQSLFNVGDLLGRLYKEIPKANERSHNATRINQIMDRLSDIGYDIMKVIGRPKEGTAPTQIAIVNSLPLIKRATKDLYRIRYMASPSQRTIGNHIDVHDQGNYWGDIVKEFHSLHWLVRQMINKGVNVGDKNVQHAIQSMLVPLDLDSSFIDQHELADEYKEMYPEDPDPVFPIPAGAFWFKRATVHVSPTNAGSLALIIPVAYGKTEAELTSLASHDGQGVLPLTQTNVRKLMSQWSGHFPNGIVGVTGPRNPMDFPPDLYHLQAITGETQEQPGNQFATAQGAASSAAGAVVAQPQN